jgi:hypothetical protein
MFLFALGEETVLGSLVKKGGRRCHLLQSKKWHLLPPFMSNKPTKGQFFPSLKSQLWLHCLLRRRLEVKEELL